MSEEIGTDDLPDDVQNVIARSWPYTLTSRERLAAMCSAVDYITTHGVEGSIVECGLWKGGSLFAAVLRLQGLGAQPREMIGFDTFCGMTEPSDLDVDFKGMRYQDHWAPSSETEPGTSPEDVMALLTSTRYPASAIRLVAGPVEATLPAAAPERIALLRLDTDWYESTRHELENLYPRLSVGGVLIIDDYDHCQGARRAVDEYLGGHRILLHRIDYTGRVGVKQHELV